MSKIVQDVRSGLKGIRGAGDALRGEMMEAADQAFEKNPHDPAAQESRAENRGVLEKGKRDMRGADEMFARHEWKHKAADEAGRREAAAHGVGPSTTSTAEYGSDRLAETFTREPASNVPGQTAQHGIERTGEDLGHGPGVNVPGHTGKYGTETRGTHAYVGETGGQYNTGRMDEHLGRELGVSVSGQTAQYGAEGRGTGANVPGESAGQYNPDRIGEPLAREPGAHVPGEQRYP